MSSSIALLDRSTLEVQLSQFISGHKELLERLSKHTQQALDLQKQLDTVRAEIEQFKGALSYSQHIQEQARKALEQTVAAEMAAKQASESAAKTVASEDPASPALV